MADAQEPTRHNWLENKSEAELLTECSEALEAGTLIREKHDPNDFHAGHTEPTFRTVVSDEAKASLADDLTSNAYDVELYHDAKFDSQIAALYPGSGSTLSVAGSGIEAYDSHASSVQDALVVAYDESGPHIFAEDKAVFKSAQYKGKARYTRIHRQQRR